MTRIHDAYDPETFRAAGHKLVDFLADQLKPTTSGDESSKVIDWIEPNDALSEVDSWLDSDDLFADVYKRCIRLHDPRYLGHQIMPPVPVSSLAGFFSDFVNNGMGVYEMGIGGSAMEQWITNAVCQRIGWDESSGGLMTCGGSLANLTAMLAARANKVSGSWNQGSISSSESTGENSDKRSVKPTQQLALMVSDQSHYCVDRAVKIMGWGEAGVIKVESDDQFRMRTDRLKEKLTEAATKGIKVIAVVGSACSTSTGSFDDLQSIGQFCRQHDLWFHVDGAHGAANLFSQKYRSLVDGIELADSVTLDFHKMLMTPAVTSALLFRDGKTAYGSFSQTADYLWQQSDDQWYNLAKRTFECTKTMLSLKVFSIVATHGWEIFDANVTRLNDLAMEFAHQIQSAEDFELAIVPSTNIVCFRYSRCDFDDVDLDATNTRIRQALVEEGRFYIVQTRLNSETWLRTTIGNPLTEPPVFTSLLDTIRELANPSQDR